jgi:serine/threonine protein kinase
MVKQLSREQFVRNLGDSGLFSEEEMAALQASSGPQEADGEAVARRLIAAGKLTPFQAAAVREGNFDVLVIGNYQVLDRLGSGGMGTVYKAQHRRMKRVVAIKVLAESVGQSEKCVQRFQREVEVIARLSHPNIVMAFDADEAEVGQFLVMEFVNGRDLDTEVAERGPLPIPEAVDCIVQAARALDYAHGQGVIHRDIKPANLLRDVSGVVKVADLGLARLNDTFERPSAPGAALTQAGTIMGTVDYMPPEQAMGLADIDHRADVYSLGCTLHYLLLGRPPYQGPTVMAILLKHRDAPIPSLCASSAEVPAALDKVFQRMVAKNREDRFASMAEVVGALEPFLTLPKLPSKQAPAPASPRQPHGSLASTKAEESPASLAEVDRALEAFASFPGLPAATVLLVEPSRSQALIIRGYLQKLGFRDIRTCPSGQKALEVARATPPGVAISTLHLPDMTGVQLAQAMRDEGPLSSTGFVLITSETDAQEAHLSSQAGHAVRLIKPFNLERLAQALAAATGSAVQQTLPPAAGPWSHLRVLLVDDSVTVRRHVREVLAGLDVHHVTEAADGAEAVNLLRQGDFDLVVTDYNMPRLDGRGLIDFIRHRGTNPSLPVIVVTSETDPARLAAVRRLGVSAICDKSFKPEVVRGILERLG